MTHATNDNPNWLIIAPVQCDARMREIASRNRWTLCERLEPVAAARIVAAIDAECIVVTDDTSHTDAVVEIAVFLADFDTARHIACIIETADADIERRLIESGVHQFNTPELFNAWALSVARARPSRSRTHTTEGAIRSLGRHSPRPFG